MRRSSCQALHVIRGYIMPSCWPVRKGRSKRIAGWCQLGGDKHKGETEWYVDNLAHTLPCGNHDYIRTLLGAAPDDLIFRSACRSINLVSMGTVQCMQILFYLLTDAA